MYQKLGHIFDKISNNLFETPMILAEFGTNFDEL